MLIGFIMIVGTIIVYLLATKVYQLVHIAFAVPVLVSTIIIITILFLLNISYNTYMIGGKWINEMLGPAVVALAYPLYQQRHLLKSLIIPILSGTFIGAVVGISTGILLAKWAGFDEIIIYSLGPKSVTTPVAMAIAEVEGGITSLAAVFVMIAGIGGVLMSTLIFRVFHLNHFLGRGVGIGSASHAIGTSRAMESSQLEGAVSTIAMVISAVIVSMIAPGLVYLLV